MANWHIITSEYPPQLGGVSDYVRDVATGLVQRGHVVHVWAPPANVERTPTPGVILHEDLGRFGRGDLQRAGVALDQLPKPRRLFVQWVPHGYGFLSMNVGFCLWLLRRARVHGDEVDIMVHESFLQFRRGAWKESAAAAVHRVMTTILLRAATRVWYTTPAWEKQWRPYAFKRSVPFLWLPMPSNVPDTASEQSIAEIQSRYATSGESCVGHFGTFGRDVADLVVRVLAASPKDAPRFHVLLIGPRGEVARDALIAARPDFAGRVHVTGPLPVEHVSAHIKACDVMLQPYSDGVTTRRTSFMAGLVLGRPIVTTLGALSEPFWEATGAASFGDPSNPGGLATAVVRLLADPAERQRLAAAARSTYKQRFDISLTIDTLHRS